ncbi:MULTISPECIES: phage tail protein [Serratia]|uniref:Phage tail protein n=2 Tax=Serratia TaxID=613 RepID=A0ABD5IF69_SERMA|nr:MULTISPECIES: phage tail protein [Serratia]MDX7082709.1 phage tail protein [Serratia marcescens]PVD43496.1 phage tail protein [Serratia liquefaciens]QDL33974.1 phage tail protein [Serratia liquefaciens]QHT52377.1 phage tail protein [Serratia liquefaciens]CAI1120102.1 Phage-related protein [Serratia liquefaciens]
MTLEEFVYSPRVNPTGDITQRVREVQFGDGYKQQSGDGINGEHQSWPLTFVGNWQYIVGIRNFLKRHEGFRAFKWRTPLFELGLYTCNGHQVTAMGKNSRGEPMYQLAATFETANRP